MEHEKSRPEILEKDLETLGGRRNNRITEQQQKELLTWQAKVVTSLNRDHEY